MILLVLDMNGRIPEKTEGWNIYMKKMEDYVRSIPDFPEPGIIFRDVTSILQDADGLHLAIDLMQEKLKDFYGNYASEEETAEAIRTLYEKTGYILDTHTAVAASVYGKYKAETKDEQTTTVIASTASPFKFSRSVMDAIDPKYDTMEEFELIDELSKIGNVKIPNAIEEIRNAPIRHKATCEVDEMPRVVKEFLGM